MQTPTRITLLYDGTCSGCTRAAAWFCTQDALVPLDAISLQDPALIQLRFPGLAVDADQFAAVAQFADGRVEANLGGDGWWLALWSLKRFRALAEHLDRAGLRPLARRAYALAAANRFWVSRLFFGAMERQLKTEKAAQTEREALVCALTPAPRSPTLAERLRHRLRPQGNPAMHHQWRNLCFIHYAVAPQTVQDLLPPGLFVDCFENKTYLGIVAFNLSGIRPWWSPALPHLSKFNELNVRVYCHDGKGNSGIYFLSLDCDRMAAVWGARAVWGLNYQHAHMATQTKADAAHFACKRQGEAQTAEYAWKVTGPAAVPEPGTLNHFLVDRYRLFLQDKKGVVRFGDVFHPPYEIAPVRLTRHSSAPIVWDGLPAPEEPPVSALFCPGVSVEVFALKKLETL